ncbi:hypothetical protein AX17_006808 [Amanita inopinata Kibby_2008]|nr:hypothetical protein AX17_006808 [Amanita inopinata Kibby_2008]
MEASKVHLALSCPDIVGLICEEMRKLDMKTLVALCLTSRNFQEPALDSIWYELGHEEELGPLIRCIPEDLWEEETIEDGHINSRTWPVIATDWVRFEINAARVRRYGFSSNGTLTRYYKIEALVYQTLSIAAREKKLLPGLKELSWGILDDTIYPYAPLFLSPTITTLHLRLEGCNNNSSFTMRLSLLPSLAVACRALTDVQLVRVADNTKLVASRRDRHMNEVLAVPPAICQWTNLRNLSLEYISGRTAFCTSDLPALRELKLSHIDSHGADVVHVSKGFPVLERLEADRCDIGFCTKLIDLMLETPLRFLDLTLDEAASASELQGLFKTMHDRLVHQSLEHFSCLAFHVVDDEEPVILRHMFPLLSFTRLSHVFMTAPCGFDLCDDDIYGISSRWTGLQELGLYTHQLSEQRSRMSIEGLVALAKHCPDLKYLSLAVDATEVNRHDESERPGKGVSNEKLKTLAVSASPIVEPILVASFLSDIFPKLETIKFFDPEEENETDSKDFEELESKWATTEKLVRAFAAVRRQERLYCAGTTRRRLNK